MRARPFSTRCSRRHLYHPSPPRAGRAYERLTATPQLHDRWKASRDPIPPAIKEILEGQLFYHEVLFRAAPSIIGKVNSLISLCGRPPPIRGPQACRSWQAGCRMVSGNATHDIPLPNAPHTEPHIRTIHCSNILPTSLCRRYQCAHLCQPQRRPCRRVSVHVRQGVDMRPRLRP